MMNQEKIQELVSRSHQDDKRAFALLVSEFQPLVFRLAFRLLCGEEEGSPQWSCTAKNGKNI